MSPPALMTADELERAYVPGKRLELVGGVLRVSEPPGFRHGRVAVELASRLHAHLRVEGTHVLVSEAGFKLASDPDTVRGPDLAVIRRDRLPQPEPTGFVALAPDLAIEIVSPNDRPGAVLAKVADWLSAGTRLVWVIDPGRRLARVYRADGTEAVVTEREALGGEDVVAGFSCLLEELL